MTKRGEEWVVSFPFEVILVRKLMATGMMCLREAEVVLRDAASRECREEDEKEEVRSEELAKGIAISSLEEVGDSLRGEPLAGVVGALVLRRSELELEEVVEVELEKLKSTLKVGEALPALAERSCSAQSSNKPAFL